MLERLSISKAFATNMEKCQNKLLLLFQNKRTTLNHSFMTWRKTQDHDMKVGNSDMPLTDWDAGAFIKFGLALNSCYPRNTLILGAGLLFSFLLLISQALTWPTNCVHGSMISLPRQPTQVCRFSSAFI